LQINRRDYESNAEREKAMIEPVDGGEREKGRETEREREREAATSSGQ
jgi:hypothetical protein